MLTDSIALTSIVFSANASTGHAVVGSVTPTGITSASATPLRSVSTLLLSPSALVNSLSVSNDAYGNGRGTYSTVANAASQAGSDVDSSARVAASLLPTPTQQALDATTSSRRDKDVPEIRTQTIWLGKMTGLGSGSHNPDMVHMLWLCCNSSDVLKQDVIVFLQSGNTPLPLTFSC